MSDLVDKCNSYIIDNARLSEQLAAEQATSKVLRDVLEKYVPAGAFKVGSQWLAEPIGDVTEYEDAFEALSQPTDDTALKSLLAAESGRIIYQHTGRDYEHLEPAEALRAWTKDLLAAERGRCEETVTDLEERLRGIGDYAHENSTGPAVPDVLWTIREMAYKLI